MAADGGLKRKRSTKKESSKKRARSESSDETDPQAEILVLENEILESRKHYNNVTKLLEISSKFEDETESAVLAAVSLCRVFVRLLAAGGLTRKHGQAEKDAVVAQWLKDRFADYKQLLIALLAAHSELASTALTLAMRTLKAEGQYLHDKEDYSFPQAFLQEIVSALLESSSDDARAEFLENFVGEFDDIRFFTLKAIKGMAVETSDQASKAELFEGAFELLRAIGGVPETVENFYLEAPKKKTHMVNSLTQHKRQGQDAWLATMRLSSTREQRKQILDIMAVDIAPWFAKPELLADFLTDSYDSGGSISLLALSGVFYLIQERNLDYPSFYAKLYSLLDREILHSKYRSRFFRLMDTFLGSTHLPAILVASFIKRLARLTLNAPPSAIVFVVPWVYNLLKRHPLCTFMLHRETRDAEMKALIENDGLGDPFLPDETDPMKTNAIESCLWELVQLQSHYHPNVATIAKIMSEQFTKQSYNLEDFLDHSYGSLLEAELSKEVRKAPVIEFQIPKRVFLPQDPASGTADTLLVKLWDF